MPRMLDLFCGRWGWSKAFAARGWECVGVDLVEPPEIPQGCEFMKADVMDISTHFVRGFDFVCASSPCQEFSVWGMPHFWPNPKFPDMGLVLFCWTRRLLDSAEVRYIMENVRPAQRFVGKAQNACGPFMLWGNAVPPLMPQGINKGMSQQRGPNGKRRGRLEHTTKKRRATEGATIPPELSSCVASYAERLLEQGTQGER